MDGLLLTLSCLLLFTVLLFLSHGQWSSGTEGFNYQRCNNSQGMMSVLWQFHFPFTTSLVPWLKVSDITRAVEANATVGVVQFLLLCSQQTSNYIEQTGRDAYHLTRRGTSVWTHRSGTAGAPLESLWGHDNNLGASLESAARKKEKGCCSNTLS